MKEAKEVKAFRIELLEILRPYANALDMTDLEPILMPMFLAVTSAIIEDLIKEGKIKLC